MRQIRIFTYKRGDTHSCKVIVNEFAGSLVFDSIVVPNNTPQKVKEKFLEEAEVAVLKIMDGESVLYRGE